jgi:hypothetical protein
MLQAVATCYGPISPRILKRGTYLSRAEDGLFPARVPVDGHEMLGGEKVCRILVHSDFSGVCHNSHQRLKG